MKSKRQEKILDIIEKEVVTTQEELINALKREGYAATQATASRDIRQLRLLKVMVDGVYRYVAPKSENDDTSKYNHALFSSIRYVVSSLNNVVIKTNPGLANAVAAGIDSLNDESILGCVAGDDTIIVVVRSEEAGIALRDRISGLVRK